MLAGYVDKKKVIKSWAFLKQKYRMGGNVLPATDRHLEVLGICGNANKYGEYNSSSKFKVI